MLFTKYLPTSWWFCWSKHTLLLFRDSTSAWWHSTFYDDSLAVILNEKADRTWQCCLLTFFMSYLWVGFGLLLFGTWECSHRSALAVRPCVEERGCQAWELWQTRPWENFWGRLLWWGRKIVCEQARFFRLSSLLSDTFLCPLKKVIIQFWIKTLSLKMLFPA